MLTGSSISSGTGESWWGRKTFFLVDFVTEEMSCGSVVLRENPQFLRQHNYLLLAHDLSLLVTGVWEGEGLRKTL